MAGVASGPQLYFMRKLLKEQIFRMLEDELKRRKRNLQTNRHEIARLSCEQKRLKKELQEINDFLWELKKSK